MISIPKSDRPIKGTWHWYDTTPDKKDVALVCPQCNSIGSLADHHISWDGSVSPSVQCRECGWHDEIFLKDWSDTRFDKLSIK